MYLLFYNTDNITFSSLIQVKKTKDLNKWQKRHDYNLLARYLSHGKPQVYDKLARHRVELREFVRNRRKEQMGESRSLKVRD